MIGRPYRTSAPIVLWLAVLVAASLACARPRQDATRQPSPANTATVQPTQLPLASEPATAAPSIEPPTIAPSPTVPAATQTVMPSPTIALTATAASLADPQGDELESLLTQLEATGDAAEAELNEIPENP